MSNYVSNAANAQAAQVDLIRKITSPEDVIALVRIEAAWRTLPDVVLKAAIDFEIENLRTALYTYFDVQTGAL